jgi:hypothetical protein
VLENHCQVRRHRIFDLSTASGTRAIQSSPASSAPRLAASSLARPGPAGARTPRDRRAVWHDGDPCVTSGPGTRKARNLASNPACTISVKASGIGLTLDGEAVRVTGPAILEQVASS